MVVEVKKLSSRATAKVAFFGCPPKPTSMEDMLGSVQGCLVE
jgi:hypothetical protein